MWHKSCHAIFSRGIFSSGACLCCQQDDGNFWKSKQQIANANVKQMAMDLQDVVYLQEWKVAEICLLWI